MVEQLKTWDRELLLFFNQFHAPALDTAVSYLTQTAFWVPLYAFILYLIFKSKGRNGWFAFAGIAITILLADQITAGVMKPLFERLRPSHEPSLEGVIHLVDNYRGGPYGFASSHAANTTGVALIVFLLLRPFYRYVWTIFLWAFIMSYTRIYLGVHYPGDILAGMLVGLLCGWGAYKLQAWMQKKWVTRSQESGNKINKDIGPS